MTKGLRPSAVSGTELRERLAAAGTYRDGYVSGGDQELRRTNLTPQQAGLTVFFTGLSGAGKSTIGKRTSGQVIERGCRKRHRADGDLVRKSLSSELASQRSLETLKHPAASATWRLSSHGGGSQ